MAMDTTSASAFNLADRQVTSIPEPNGTCSDENRTCTEFILSTLQRLCVPPSVCLSTSEDGYSARDGLDILHAQTRRMDDALRVNRSALELVSRVLQCSCSLIPSVQLLLVMICDRVVAWYQAMLRDDERRIIHEQVPFSTSPSDDYDQSELVLAMPITMGEFTVDAPLQIQIRSQLVINEMRRAENTIHQFAARVQQAPSQSSTAHRQYVYDIVSGMLRDQLQAQANFTQGRVDP